MPFGPLLQTIAYDDQREIFGSCFDGANYVSREHRHRIDHGNNSYSPRPGQADGIPPHVLPEAGQAQSLLHIGGQKEPANQGRYHNPDQGDHGDYRRARYYQNGRRNERPSNNTNFEGGDNNSATTRHAVHDPNGGNLEGGEHNRKYMRRSLYGHAIETNFQGGDINGAPAMRRNMYEPPVSGLESGDHNGNVVRLAMYGTSSSNIEGSELNGNVLRKNISYLGNNIEDGDHTGTAMIEHLSYERRSGSREGAEVNETGKKRSLYDPSNDPAAAHETNVPRINYEPRRSNNSSSGENEKPSCQDVDVLLSLDVEAMEPDQRIQFVKDVIHYLHCTCDLAQSAIAKLSGGQVKQETISQLLHGTYAAKPRKKMCQGFMDSLKSYVARTASSSPLLKRRRTGKWKDESTVILASQMLRERRPNTYRFHTEDFNALNTDRKTRGFSPATEKQVKNKIRKLRHEFTNNKGFYDSPIGRSMKEQWQQRWQVLDASWQKTSNCVVRVGNESVSVTQS